MDEPLDDVVPEPRPLVVDADRLPVSLVVLLPLPRLELVPDRLLEPLVDGLLDTEMTPDELVTTPEELVTRLAVLTLTLPETDELPLEVPALAPQAASSVPAVSVINTPDRTRRPFGIRVGTSRIASRYVLNGMLPS